MSVLPDQRCGITGPILAQEFKRQLRKNEHVHHEHFDVELISHIGGHKYAGNVIIYFPETDVWKTRYLQTLSGMGIWYGRVEPRHVEGILEQTVFGGQIIKELFRGGIDGRGGQLRLANIESVALGTASTGYRPRSGWLKRMRVDT